MSSIDEQILRATKEIVVKFIEAGRVSPTGFNETFKNVYKTVQVAVKGPAPDAQAPENEEQ
ncbi:MAG: hypothetical protein B6I22_08730 [Desulfobacteraceae bacterium 4572_123]|nr:MAG: hypothetical protein B6I22_08730 [Desulfobacteraceae bacterium 4572_123]